MPVTTPDFPAWHGLFARQLRRRRTTCGESLHKLEALAGAWIPRWRLAQQEQKAHSRDRCWNLRLVFWTFLWRVSQPGASCREAIDQAQALCRRLGRRRPANKNSPYCQARAALPLERLDAIACRWSESVSPARWRRRGSSAKRSCRSAPSANGAN